MFEILNGVNDKQELKVIFDTKTNVTWKLDEIVKKAITSYELFYQSVVMMCEFSNCNKQACKGLMNSHLNVWRVVRTNFCNGQMDMIEQNSQKEVRLNQREQAQKTKDGLHL